jgi:hypothetical protein
MNLKTYQKLSLLIIKRLLSIINYIKTEGEETYDL